MSGPRLRLALAFAFAAGMALFAPAPALARQFGYQSPAGRRIYGTRERFGEALEHKRWVVVSEVAVGAGPEGNLAVLLG